MIENYKNELLNDASILDAITKSYGVISKLATSIVESDDKIATLSLLNKIAEIAKEQRFSKETKRANRNLHSSLIKYYGYIALQDINTPDKTIQEDPRTLDELLSELNALVGLKTVKAKVNDLIAYQKVQKLRKEKSLLSATNTMHLAFTGNPGTGKTTVARIIGHIYKKIGLLSKGHFVEVSRTDLIAGYQGQTALKVKGVIEKAKGGVLFIDEAYSITENKHSDSYGRECLTELTKALEDYRDDLVVIVAGYTEPMHDFFESNPGLKSRFNNFIEFPDYSEVELEKILIAISTENDYRIEENALVAIRQLFQESVSEKDENFANGRLARNLYDDLVMNHARRVVNIPNPTKEELTTIVESDFTTL